MLYTHEVSAGSARQVQKVSGDTMSPVPERYVCSLYDDPVYFRAEDRWIDGVRQTVCEFVIRRGKGFDDLVLAVQPPRKQYPHNIVVENPFDKTVRITDADVQEMTHNYQDALVALAAPVML